MSASDDTCFEDSCSEPALEDFERCAYHRAKLEEARRAYVKGGAGFLGTIVLALIGRGRGSS